MHVIGKISGGVGSYSAMRRYIDLHGLNNVKLLFTDTLCEDQDAYRFLIAGAANLLGVNLPPHAIPSVEEFPMWEDRDAYKNFVSNIAEQTRYLIPNFNWLIDGRDPWDIYEHERFLGNSRVDPCSKILKRKLSDQWLRQNCTRSDTVVILGLDHEEMHRFDDGRGGGVRNRMAAEGWQCEAPLCEPPYTSWISRLTRLFWEGLWLPRLNSEGFVHNNCGGFCCKGGQGHWKLMLKVFPERYAYAQYRENKIRETLGDVSMLTDRRGGQKKPLTLTELKERELDSYESSDMGACNCFLG